MSEFDLSKFNSAELEDMQHKWSDQILEAEKTLQIVEMEYSAIRKKCIDLQDSIKKGRHVVKRLEREKSDIRSAMFRKMREGI